MEQEVGSSQVGLGAVNQDAVEEEAGVRQISKAPSSPQGHLL